jgi:putative toxin-antitoxin system antitoxin component (TIGR02293 family)
MGLLVMERVGDLLGSTPGSELDLVKLAEEGVPTKVVNILTGHGLTSTEVYSIVIPQRTLKHRQSRKEPLNREESDKAIRAARALARAQTVFGSDEKALAWMRHAKRRFDGRTPLQMLTTESGGRMVEEMLIQIDEGMVA